uniref:Uncharacterized protein n=1 Tax=Anguilla anguilla TaxID=7936 RepID=A0A0E9X361_ANGAN
MFKKGGTYQCMYRLLCICKTMVEKHTYHCMNLAPNISDGNKKPSYCLTLNFQ